MDSDELHQAIQGGIYREVRQFRLLRLIAWAIGVFSGVVDGKKYTIRSWWPLDFDGEDLAKQEKGKIDPEIIKKRDEERKKIAEQQKAKAKPK